MAQFIGDEPAPRDVSFEELWAGLNGFEGRLRIAKAAPGLRDFPIP
jgi:hypothetical protein